MIYNFQATLGASAIVVATADANDNTFSPARPIPGLMVNNGPTTIYVGGPSMTTANGIPILGSPNHSLSVQTYPGDVWYAIAPAGNSDFRFLQAGVVI